MKPQTMQKVFLDTNIIIDFIADREPFSSDAANIFQLAIDNKIQLYATDLSFVNVVYILRKKIGMEKAYQFLILLRSIVNITSIGEKAIDAAIKLHAKDFEDAVQYMAAKKMTADILLTRNKKDFPYNDVPVMLPIEFLDSHHQ
jgi:predicted nucleic acid-binding protein